MLGYIFVIVIKGAWNNNKEEIMNLGRDLFQFDESTFREKRIPVSNTIIDENRAKPANAKIHILPGKSCPFRYANFVRHSGNAIVRIKGGKKLRISELLDCTTEVVADRSITTKDDLSILIPEVNI